MCGCRRKLAEIAAWNESDPADRRTETAPADGHHHIRKFSYVRAREARARGREDVETGDDESAADERDSGILLNIMKRYVVIRGVCSAYLVEAIPGGRGCSWKGKDDMHRF